MSVKERLVTHSGFIVTFEERVYFPDGDGSQGSELTEREFHEEEWQPY